MSNKKAATTTTACKVIARFPMGGKTCEYLAFHRPEDRGLVNSDTMLARGEADQADMGQEHGEFFEQHANEVPRKFWGKMPVFPKWRRSRASRLAGYFYRGDDGWYRRRGPLDLDWCGDCVLVRFSS